MSTRGYICWLIDEGSRHEVMASVPPAFDLVVCHHVTLAYDVPADTPLPEPKIGWVVGEIMDAGVQAVVVEIDGDTIRPDGDRYHITLSLDKGRFPEEARRLTRKGWWPIERFPVRLTPAFIAKESK